MQYHLIGVGGAGMSVIAELLAANGDTVTGSDRQDSAILQHLAELGLSVHPQHDPTQVPAEATVVVSSAIRPNNPELVVARERGQEVIHRSEALCIAAADRRFVAVAGAHGKTTTSVMIAAALSDAGADPGAAIGGPILGIGSGALSGGGDVFVAEADESDGSFLNYRPQVAVVTNIEADHLDHFGSVDAFEQIFFDFASRITPGGTLICCGDDPGAARLARRSRTELTQIQTWTYGRSPDCDIRIVQESLAEAGADATLLGPGQGPTPLSLQVTGEHNVLNAAGAWAVGLALGFDGEEFARCLHSFVGAGRRFELIGQAGGRRVFDDYAHHPTELAAALKMARQVAGEGRIIAVFQPHLYSRTQNFAERFAQVLSTADQVILADIYAAREDPMPGVTSALIAEQLEDLGHPDTYVPGLTVDEVCRRGAALAEPGDVLLLIGAGDIFLGGDAAVEEWS